MSSPRDFHDGSTCVSSEAGAGVGGSAEPKNSASRMVPGRIPQTQTTSALGLRFTSELGKGRRLSSAACRGGFVRAFAGNRCGGSSRGFEEFIPGKPRASPSARHASLGNPLEPEGWPTHHGLALMMPPCSLLGSRSRCHYPLYTLETTGLAAGAGAFRLCHAQTLTSWGCECPPDPRFRWKAFLSRVVSLSQEKKKKTLSAPMKAPLKPGAQAVEARPRRYDVDKSTWLAG